MSNFARRADPYDDSYELDNLREMVEHDDDLRDYIKAIAPITYGGITFTDHPDGKYGIDAVLSNAGNRVLNIDVEMWSNFNLKSFHLLERKEKYLHMDIPFVLIVFNQNLSKWLAVDGKTILQFEYRDDISFGGKKAFGGFSSGGRRIPRNAAYIRDTL
jgi:hypothetical protein